MKQSQFARALWYGILGALFFAFTFIFNRSMNLSGGSWMWSASLRYLFSLPMLAVMVWRKGELAGVLSAIKKAPLTWLVWSTVGFGLFYGPLSLASIYGESWFVAATWQITILAGLLLTPLFGQKVPGKQLLMTLVILLGIILIQIPYFGSGLGSGVVRASLLILLAAFAYPLGNRKMMVHCKQDQLFNDAACVWDDLDEYTFLVAFVSFCCSRCWTSIRWTDFTVFNCGCLFWSCRSLAFLRGD